MPWQHKQHATIDRMTSLLIFIFGPAVRRGESVHARTIYSSCNEL
jgi:hypothetical protein